MFKRSLLRIAGRRLGITQIYRSGNDVSILCASITNSKWEKMIKQNVVPSQLMLSVLYSTTIDSDYGPREYPAVGVITMKNVFSSSKSESMVCISLIIIPQHITWYLAHIYPQNITAISKLRRQRT